MTKLTLIDSHDEVDTIRTFVFETAGLTWQPGQYQTYELTQMTGEPAARTRFFTIASAPGEGVIHISTRVTDSPFKQALNALQPGDTIEARNLEGDFIWQDDQPVVLVAGGIGVTPYRSMLVERAAQGLPLNAHLLYFGRDDSFAFAVEFHQLTDSHPELTIEYITGQPITADAILARAPQVATLTTYLSGPEAMVDAVGDELTARGVTLKQDWFPGYDQTTY